MNETWNLAGYLDHAWDVVHTAVSDLRPLSRLVSFATIGFDQKPQNRTVALREAARDLSALTFYTDMRSAKVAELSANPACALTLWDSDALLQVRVCGTAKIARGTPVQWDKVPEIMREAYGHVPAPGTPITSGDAWDIAPDIAHFAVITVSIEQLDVVYLGETGHLRARYQPTDHWRGEWFSP